jgi:hypothetical protein
VQTSKGIRVNPSPVEEIPPEVADNSKLKSYYDHHLPFYEKMQANRLIPSV